MSPADPETYCPTCGLAWQVRGCKPGYCAVETRGPCSFWADGVHAYEVRQIFNPRKAMGAATYEPAKVCRCGIVIAKAAGAMDASP